LCFHIREPVRKLLDSVAAVPQAHRLLYCLPPVIGVVRGAGAALVTVEDAIVDEPSEDTLGGFI